MHEGGVIAGFYRNIRKIWYMCSLSMVGNSLFGLPICLEGNTILPTCCEQTFTPSMIYITLECVQKVM